MAEIKILVKYKTDTLEFTVPQSMTIDELAKLVATEIKYDKFELKQGLIVLLGYKPVSKYYEGGEFEVSIKKLLVTVDVNGKTHDIQVTGDMTVSQLKEEYDKVSTISAKEEILTVKGKVMDDNEILDTYEITDESKIFGLTCNVQVKYKDKCDEYTVPRTMSISSFKEKVANKINVKGEYFDLRQNEAKLENGPINDYLEGSEILVDMKKLQVTVNINGKDFYLPVTADMIVSQFTLEVNKVFKTLICEQKFRLENEVMENDKIMENDKMLNVYDIREGSKITGMLCEVYVKYKNDSRKFTVDRTMLFKELKTKVAEKIKIRDSMFKLYKNETLLEDQQITDYLGEGITYVVKMINFNITADMNSNITIEVTADMTVSQLKSKISNKTNYPSNNMQLEYNGYYLQDNELLEKYEVIELCVIKVVASLRGG